MITPKIGQAMGQAAERHNDVRKQKLVVFYKALEIVQATTDWKSGESKVVFTGKLQGKKAEISLLKVGEKIILNLTVEGKTFEPLTMTQVVNENNYLTWNMKVREEMAGPSNPLPQEQKQERPPPRPRPNQIARPKVVSQKAKTHDVTPLDRDTFRVKSGESGKDYFVRLLPNEDGGTCDCKWGERRKYRDNYKSACSHVQAVYLQIEGQRSRTVAAWSTKEEAKRQHRQMTDIGDGVILTLRKS